MSCLIYLVRHGETYWNELRKMQGQVNIPLNEKGRKQARLTGERLKDVVFDICYTSPLSRARETAELILGDGSIEIVDSPLLLEQGYGLAEGESQNGFYDKTSPLYGYESQPEKYRPGIGAESFGELFQRAEEAVETLIYPAEARYQNVLVTAHGAILCSILAVIEKSPLEEFWNRLLPNCGVAVLQVKNGKCSLLYAEEKDGNRRKRADML